jgi:hypothetical protein
MAYNNRYQILVQYHDGSELSHGFGFSVGRESH